MFLEKLFRKKEEDSDVKAIREYVEMINRKEEATIQELEKINDLLSTIANEMGKR